MMRLSNCCELVTSEQLQAEKEIEEIVFKWLKGEISQGEAEKLAIEKFDFYMKIEVFSSKDKKSFLYRRDADNPRKITTFFKDIIISQYNERQVMEDYRDIYEEKFGIKIEVEEVGTVNKGLMIANFWDRKNSPNKPDYKFWTKNNLENKIYCETKYFKNIQMFKIENLRMYKDYSSYLVVGLPSRLIIYSCLAIEYLLTRTDQICKWHGKPSIKVTERYSPLNLEELSKKYKVVILNNPNERDKK